MTDGSRFHGLEIELHRGPGVRVLRVVHPGAQTIGEHRHDLAYIGLHALGRYHELSDAGEQEMAGPSAVLHPAGRPHADTIADAGLETVTIEFDPAWLRHFGYGAKLDRSRIWSGGAAALAGRRLMAELTTRGATDESVGRATAAFLHRAFRSDLPRRPAWLERVEHAISVSAPLTTDDIARRLDLNAAWLARAYRHFVGEGLHETMRRKRVERACKLLRRTDDPLADVAQAAGFCDQSHMNRGFRQLLGRTPLAVRSERLAFAA